MLSSRLGLKWANLYPWELHCSHKKSSLICGSIYSFGALIFLYYSKTKLLQNILLFLYVESHCFLRIVNMFFLSNFNCQCSPCQSAVFSTTWSIVIHQCFTLFRAQNSVLSITEEIHWLHICFYYPISPPLTTRLDTGFLSLWHFWLVLHLNCVSKDGNNCNSSSLEEFYILMAAFHNT